MSSVPPNVWAMSARRTLNLLRTTERFYRVENLTYYQGRRSLRTGTRVTPTFWSKQKWVTPRGWPILFFQINKQQEYLRMKKFPNQFETFSVHDFRFRVSFSKFSRASQMLGARQDFPSLFTFPIHRIELIWELEKSQYSLSIFFGNAGCSDYD